MNKNKIPSGRTLLKTALVFVALSIGNLIHAAPTTSPVTTPQISVHLQQSIDKNCDGVAEATAKAIPGTCIIYTLTTTNNSETPIYNLQFNGHIPEHTRLYQQIWLDNDIFALGSTRIDNTNKRVKTQIEQLGSGKQHAIVLQYAVQIL